MNENKENRNGCKRSKSRDMIEKMMHAMKRRKKKKQKNRNETGWRQENKNNANTDHVVLQKTKTVPIQIMQCFKKQKLYQCRSYGASKNKNSVNTDHVVLQNSPLIWNTPKKGFHWKKKRAKDKNKKEGKRMKKKQTKNEY